MQHIARTIALLSLLVPLILCARDVEWTERSDNGHSTITRIENAFRSGDIDRHLRIEYLAKAILASEELPAAYRTDGTIKCGTWILKTVRERWPRLPLKERNALMTLGFSERGVLQPPAPLDSEHETDHFIIHYSVATGDTNAVSPEDQDNDGIPDYIEQVETTLERVWRKEVDSLGYVAPPPDGGVFGSDKYDVYIRKLEPGLYGYVSATGEVGDNPNSMTVQEQNAMTSSMYLRNNYQGFQESELGALRVTVAHEFLHSIQYGYDAYERQWLFESTAAWVEDEVYDGINSYLQYIRSWLQAPQVSLDDTSTHWYGSAIFFKHLSENVGNATLIRRVWEKSVDNNSKTHDFSLVAVEQALNDYGTNFAQALTGMAITNLIQSGPVYNYDEAGLYPDVRIADDYWGNVKATKTVQRMGSRYYSIAPNLSQTIMDNLSVSFDDSGVTGAYSAVLVAKSSGANDVHLFHPGSNQFNLGNTSGYDEIYLIVCNTTTADYSKKFPIRI